ncbi:MAG: hypothetical protein J0H42_23150 [Rhizobiales bacterium]|nr:hypothetical protein [Hyphomicrobiales bacterium]
MFSAALYAHVRTFLCTLHMRPRVQRASGIPCALHLKRAGHQQSSGAMRRENAKLYQPSFVCNKRGAFVHESEAKQSVYPRAEMWMAWLRSQ